MKVRLLWSLDFPMAIYGRKSWAMKKTDQKIIETFELWVNRHVSAGWKDGHINVLKKSVMICAMYHTQTVLNLATLDML